MDRILHYPLINISNIECIQYKGLCEHTWTFSKNATQIDQNTHSYLQTNNILIDGRNNRIIILLKPIYVLQDEVELHKNISFPGWLYILIFKQLCIYIGFKLNDGNFLFISQIFNKLGEDPSFEAEGRLNIENYIQNSDFLKSLSLYKQLLLLYLNNVDIIVSFSVGDNIVNVIREHLISYENRINVAPIVGSSLTSVIESIIQNHDNYLNLRNLKYQNKILLNNDVDGLEEKGWLLKYKNYNIISLFGNYNTQIHSEIISSDLNEKEFFMFSEKPMNKKKFLLKNLQALNSQISHLGININVEDDILILTETKLKNVVLNDDDSFLLVIFYDMYDDPIQENTTEEDDSDENNMSTDNVFLLE